MVTILFTILDAITGLDTIVPEFLIAITFPYIFVLEIVYVAIPFVNLINPKYV